MCWFDMIAWAGCFDLTGPDMVDGVDSAVPGRFERTLISSTQGADTRLSATAVKHTS